MKKNRKKSSKYTNYQDPRIETWEQVRAEIKPWFAAEDISSCELRLEGCEGRSGLGFAHSLKRRYIVPPKNILDEEGWAEYRKNWREVVYACQHCHTIIERWGNKEWRMLDKVRETIAKRGKRPE